MLCFHLNHTLSKLIGNLGASESFEIALTIDATIFRQNCFYNPATKIVSIFVYLTNIPDEVGTGILFSVPVKYRPKRAFSGACCVYYVQNKVYFNGVSDINIWGEVNQAITPGYFSQCGISINYFIE